MLACFLASLAASLLVFATPVAAEHTRRITYLYDAFGPPSELVKDWGFAALVEYGGKRILFDTGNDPRIFAHNVKVLGVDLSRLDAVVISHRHGDHTSGLTHLLEVNPDVTIYAPWEGAFFKSVVPSRFLEPHPGLPSDLRYFGGKPPERVVTGTPWEQANFETVTGPTEIFPGFHLLTIRSEKPGTVEMNEVSLAFRTPTRVRCSHLRALVAVFASRAGAFGGGNGHDRAAASNRRLPG